MSMQSISIIVFRTGLLQLSAGTYEASALTAVISDLELF